MKADIKFASPPSPDFNADLKEITTNTQGEWVKVAVPRGLSKRKVWFVAFYDGNLLNETWFYNGFLQATLNRKVIYQRPWGFGIRNGAATPVYDDDGTGKSKSILVSYGDQLNLVPATPEAVFKPEVAFLRKMNVYNIYVHPFNLTVECDSFAFNAVAHRNAGLVTVAYLAVESSFGI